MSVQQKFGEFGDTHEQPEPRRDYTDSGDGLIIEIVGRRYTNQGVKLLKENNAGGTWSCSWETIDWGTAEEIKQCPGCGGFHSAANPELCHSCAFNQ